jgi:hypothetical protein
MSYENKFTLILKNTTLTNTVKQCPEDKTVFDDKSVYCNKCGTELESVDKVYDATENIIKTLRENSDDANYLLNEKGGTNCCGSGHRITNDIKKHSSLYPTVLFILDIVWDSGFNEPPSRYYLKNGKIQQANAKLIFDDFDESKLK